ncbi:TetR/AcrR family transcriptional regulator [Paenibacillus sp. N1-5-1-14]|uniref:TetR/AcrR family transcriptional regulator n=1 Tax=Paenibacillus radicibacter TaxID=2972488 RepID=UPI0021596C38|nr:TetR/AcrR family transcriptional regulator [Paenibacillus radicibacter]MCR8645220.1 TetR/AcrR family transcriptional regulator [Paenibacillus radicibacter]
MKREEKKRITREKIIQSAMYLFAEQGYEATTVHQITERAGVAKGTFFNYFACKEDIFCDVQLMFAVEEVQKIKDKPGPLIPHIRNIIANIDHQLKLSRPLVLAVCQGNLTNANSIQNMVEQIEELTEALTEVAAVGQERGELIKSMPPEMIAELAIQTFLGARLLWSIGRGDEDLSGHMAITFELFFRSIAVHP